jgi:hypothetical protein
MKTTTTSPLAEERDEHRVPAVTHEANRSFSLNRSTALILMHEALSRARLLEAAQARTQTGATRPARLVAMQAARRRERLPR